MALQHNSPLSIILFVFVLLVTYLRSSELLALRKNDIVRPLAALLPCRSIVIAASETGVSIRTGIRDGSVVMDQVEFRSPCSRKHIQCCNLHFGTQRYDNVPNAPQWSKHRSVRGFSTLQETRSVEGVQRCHRCRIKDITSTTTHFVLSQSYLRQCCQSKLASSCSQTLSHLCLKFGFSLWRLRSMELDASVTGPV